MASMPVSSMSDEKVLAYRLARWDFALLQTHGVDTTAYIAAQTANAQLSKKSREETKVAVQATYVVEQR